MLGSSRVAAQLAASREGLGSMRERQIYTNFPCTTEPRFGHDFTAHLNQMFVQFIISVCQLMVVCFSPYSIISINLARPSYALFGERSSSRIGLERGAQGH
jgi:hypothetical protein